MSRENFTEKELLDLLPKDPETDPGGKRLAELLAQVTNQRVPVSSLNRIWTLGSLQAKVAAGYFAYWLRSRFSSAEEKQRLKGEAHLAAALQLLGTMGYLRGAVMKIGQMLASLPEVMPEQFAEMLSALHFEAPPMHYALVREVFLDEFGQEPEEMFAYFDHHAFAAASLGQVHRARLKSGEEVAVKIQYPGIAGTIRNDMGTLRLLLQPLCFTRDWQNTLDKLADVERMLLMETDYEQEARFIRGARAVFNDSDMIAVPQVYDDYSTGRVLTTAYLHGCHLKEYLATNPSQEERDHFTHLLTVATFRLFYRLHWLISDPHPGNFIFMDDGRLGLIDFGCTFELNDEEWRLSNEPVIAMLGKDEARLDRLIAEACLFDSPEEMTREHFETARRWFLWFIEPWEKDGLFDFGDREFFQRGIDSFMEMSLKRYTRSVTMTTWSSRFALGGRAFCYRLKGRCEFRKIYLQESAAVSGQ